MGLEFIDRSVRTSGIVLLIFFPFGLYYLGVYSALAVLSGGVWSIINLLFTTRLVRSTIRPEGADKAQAIGLGLFKFPALYLAGYFLLKVPYFDPVHLVIGFSSTLCIMVLRVMGRVVIGVDDGKQNSRKLQKAV